MANIIIAEGSGRLDSLYGKYQAPIASCIEDVTEAWKTKEIGPKIFRQVKSEHWAEAFTSVTAASDWQVLGAAMTAMQNFKGDNGETMGLEPDTLIIPNIASLKKSVFAVLGSYDVPGSDHNDFNYLFGSMRVLVWPYLNDYIGTTNTAPWFLMDSTYNEQCDGAVWLDRVDCEITSRLGANDENIWDGYARLSAGFVDWRFILGGGLSGGSTL